MTQAPHHIDIPLRFGDIDALGHVNNVAYFQFLEEARVRSFGEWTGDPDRASGLFFVVASQKLEYRAAISYRVKPIRVEMWAVRVGSSSLELGYIVRDHPDTGEKVYAVASTTMVHVDPATQRPAPLADELTATLEGHQGGPVPFRDGGAAA